MNTNKNTKWTESDIEYLKNNYSNLGGQCAIVLNKSLNSLRCYAQKFGLKVNKSTVSFNHKKTIKNNFQSKINMDMFYNIQTPEVAYILGLLWADGYLNSSIGYAVELKLVRNDFDKILYTFQKVGLWKIYYQQPKNRQPVGILRASNIYLFEFLSNLDYKIKSGASPYKILNLIPKHLQHYWWRGYTDGDGTFSLSKNNRPRISISGCFNQDWSFADNFIKKYTICKSISRKNHKSSKINICAIKNILDFGNYIYQDYELDKIGFSRKYEKFLQIKNIFIC